MIRPNWDQYFMEIAQVVSTRATCDRKHVGAVITRKRRIVSTGYNGSLPGHLHCSEIGHDMDHGHCVRTTHAEMNAILQADRRSLYGARMYVNTYPCWPCMRAIIAAGITSVVYDQDYRKDLRVEQAAKDSGVTLIQLTKGSDDEADVVVTMRRRNGSGPLSDERADPVPEDESESDL